MDNHLLEMNRLREKMLKRRQDLKDKRAKLLEKPSKSNAKSQNHQENAPQRKEQPEESEPFSSPSSSKWAQGSNNRTAEDPQVFRLERSGRQMEDIGQKASLPGGLFSRASGSQGGIPGLGDGRDSSKPDTERKPQQPPQQPQPKPVQQQEVIYSRVVLSAIAFIPTRLQ